MTTFEKMKQLSPADAAKMFFRAFGIKKKNRLCIGNREKNFTCTIKCEDCIKMWLDSECEDSGGQKSADKMTFYWMSPENKPSKDETVLVIVSGQSDGVRFEHALELAIYDENEGWILENYPEAVELEIEAWMDIPMPANRR